MKVFITAGTGHYIITMTDRSFTAFFSIVKDALLKMHEQIKNRKQNTSTQAQYKIYRP